MDALLVRPLVDLDVLSPVECADVVRRLEAERGRWLRRSAGFSTYGVAAYLDVVHSDDPETAYYGRLAEWNERIDAGFHDVLDRAAAAIADLTGRPTRFCPAVARPGFHIFEAESIGLGPGSGQHFDLQHRAVRWPFVPVGEEILSFTLALKLPADGGGLDVWDIQEAELRRLRAMGRAEPMTVLGETKPYRRHAYRPGTMAVQRQPIMHRIACVTRRAPGDQRVTLQGHGVRDAAGWVLYW